MGTRLDSIVVDARDPLRLAGWWAGTLDWWPGEMTPAVCTVLPPEGEAGLPLVFCRVGDLDVRASGHQRLHLDLATSTVEHQQAHVLGLIADGAERADIGQGLVPWAVLRDPECNLFCVLEPREVYRGTGSVAAIVQQARDPSALADFWQAASGWDVVERSEAGARLRHRDHHGPFLELLRADAPKEGKNRWHLDVVPRRGGDRDTEVKRLVELGATHVDVGQSAGDPADVTWVVLADPEGNEFCLLRGH
jgi:hypothetical protein